MGGESPDFWALGIGVEGLEEAARPAYVVAVGADGYEARGLAVVGWGPGGEATEDGGVLFGRQVAAAANSGAGEAVSAARLFSSRPLL